MKKLKILLFSAILLLSLVNSRTIWAADERIDSFDSDIKIQNNGEVDVTETIQYSFPAPKHGTIRYIPVKYAARNAGSLTGNYNVYLTIQDVKIKKDNGDFEAVPYEKSESGNQENIKIGDPKQEISGQVTYQIKYKLQRAINFSPKDNDQQDEFYWNVTGNGWEVPIAKSSAEVHFPVNVDPNSWKFACFTGLLGSTEKECLEEATGADTVKFTSKWELPARAGLTIVAGFPKGIVKPPTASENLSLALQHDLYVYIFLLIPFLAFIILFVVWFLKGRDPKRKGTIIPFYQAPDNLTPVELGTLFDEKADPKDISSSIIDLAVRGYFKIREVEIKPTFGIFRNKPDYEIILLRYDQAIPEAEKKIFNTIFEPRTVAANQPGTPQDRITVKLSDLQNSFPVALGDIKENIYSGLVRKGYFPKSPERVRNSYLFVGAIVAFLGIIIFINNFGIIGAGSVFVTGIMIAIFGYFMPRKTIKGVNAYEKILGLKDYLSVAEADRIKFHNAPAKKPEIFEKLLPYAMVLGVEKEWAKQFEGIYNRPPMWYEGTGTPMNNFSALYLANSLSNFRDTANAAIGMRVEGGGAAGGLSGFGGGGFSGGGFGGGGGSSW